MTVVCCLVVLAGVLPSGSYAQTAIDYSTRMHWVAGTSLPGAPAVSPWEGYQSGVDVVEHPYAVGKVIALCRTSDVVAGDAVGYLTVVDVTDPTGLAEPVDDDDQIAVFQLGGNVNDMVVDPEFPTRPYLYFCTTSMNLQIIALGDPTPADPSDLGLSIYEMWSSPGSPTPSAYDAVAVDIENRDGQTLAYVYNNGNSSWSGILRIWDVTDPTAPVLLGSLSPGAGSASDMKVFSNSQGHGLLLLNSNGGVKVDVTYPGAPEVLGSLDLFGAAKIGKAFRVGYDINEFIVTSSPLTMESSDWGAKRFFMSDPATVVPDIEWGYSDGLEISGGEVTLGNRFHISTPDGITEISVISDGRNNTIPKVSGRAATNGPGLNFGIAQWEEYETETLYIFSTGNINGLQVVDATHDYSPAPLYHSEPAETSARLLGDLLVCSSGNLFLAADPTALVAYPNPITPFGESALVDRYAFTSDASTIRVWDLADPAQPVLLGEAPGGGWNTRIEAFHENGAPEITVWIPTDQAGGIFYLFDPQDPGSFPIPGSGPVGVPMGGRAADMAYDCGRYFACYGDVVMADGTNAGFYSVPQDVEALCPSGDILYVAERDVGIHVLNVADISAPVEVGFFTVQEKDAKIELAIDANILYVLQGNNGVYVVDVSDPTHPAPLGGVNPPGLATTIVSRGSARDLAVGEGSVYLSDSGNGMYVLPSQIIDPAAQDYIAVTGSAGTGGLIAPRGPVHVSAECGRVDFSIIPEEGFAISDVTVNGVSKGAVAQYTFMAVPGSLPSIAVDATFLPIPVVSVLAPNGGEIVMFGDVLNVAWNAGGAKAISCVDVLLSRDGTAGTYETLASCLPNTGSWDWVVTGPATEHAVIKVVATGDTGGTGGDASDAEFEIIDSAVAAVLSWFEATPQGDGIRLEWAWHDPDTFVSTVVERSYGPNGPWAPLAVPIVTEGKSLVAVDPEPTPGQKVWYRLTATTTNGQTAHLGLVEAEAVARTAVFALAPVSPNPTLGAASIKLSLPEAERVLVAVYDVRGIKVAVLADGVLSAGDHDLSWTGRTNAGPAATGVYFIRARTSRRELSRRLVLTR